MAEIAFSKRQKHGAVIVSWETVATDDTLQAFEPPTGYDLESVQVIGTFGGSTFTLTGSNDGGTTFNDLIAAGGPSAAGMIKPDEQAEQFSGTLTGGAGGDIDVHAYFRARG